MGGFVKPRDRLHHSRVALNVADEMQPFTFVGRAIQESDGGRRGCHHHGRHNNNEQRYSLVLGHLHCSGQYRSDGMLAQV